MSDYPRHALGRDAETLAQSLLRSNGLSLLHRNWRGRRGELDLVMREGDILVIVEVRARVNRPHEDALASIDTAKTRRLTSTVREYLCSSGLGDTLPVRLDVVTVTGPPTSPDLRWWRNVAALRL